MTPAKAAPMREDVMPEDENAAQPFMDRFLDGSFFADDFAELSQAFARHRLAHTARSNAQQEEEGVMLSPFAALRVVMTWINNWGVPFADDDEWQGDKALIQTAIAASGENISAHPSLELCVQFSDDGQHIRKWSRFPFEGGECLYSHRLAYTARPDAGDGTWGPVTEWEMIDRLRDEEADSVTVLCDNPEGPPNNAVECCGFWTGFADRRFEGATIREALTAAVAAKDEAAKVGYPPMSVPDAGDEDVERVAIAQQLEQALHDRMEDRFKILAFLHRHTILAALRDGVDRGMVVVPREPTEAMIQAGMKGRQNGARATAEEVYSRMIAAALDTEQPR